MEWKLFAPEEVVLVHDAVLNDGELSGLAGNKSLAGALSRVEFRVQYGLISNVYELAAMYAVAIAQAHVFNDANKRTAHAVMKLSLKMHGVTLVQDAQEIGGLIIAVAQGKVDEEALARWLREHTI